MPSFLERVHHYPALGKNFELRSALEDWVRSRASDGSRISLSGRVVFNEGNVFTTRTIYESLEALEKSRDAMLSSAQFKDFANRTAPMRRRQVKIQLLSPVVSPATSGLGGRYIHMAHCAPAAGKDAEVRSILEEFAKRYQQERPGFRLLRQVLNPGGTVFTIADTYESLAEYDSLFDSRPQFVQQAIAKAGAFCRGPIAHQLDEVLIPFPS